jgi:CHRD domain-containing protein
MRKLVFAIAVIVAGALTLAGAVAFAHGDNGKRNLSAKLNGYNEVTSKSTPARGTFRARIENGGSRIHYRLSYQGFTESPAVVSHIHFSQPHVNGAVVAFLCGGGGKPACPNPGGTVEGDIVAADVLAQVPDQGIAAGEIAEFIRAMRHGATYVNIHTVRFPAGEIRGQIGKGHGHDNGDRKDK